MKMDVEGMSPATKLILADRCMSCERCRWSVGGYYMLAKCKKFETKSNGICFSGSPCPQFLLRGRKDDYPSVGVGKVDARYIGKISSDVLPSLKAQLGTQAFYWSDVVFHTTLRTADNLRALYAIQIKRKEDCLYGGDQSVIASYLEDVFWMYPRYLGKNFITDCFCAKTTKNPNAIVDACIPSDASLASKVNDDWDLISDFEVSDRLHIASGSVDEFVATWQVLESPQAISIRRKGRIAFMREFDGVQFWVMLYPPLYFGHFVVKFIAAIRK